MKNQPKKYIKNAKKNLLHQKQKQNIKNQQKHIFKKSLNMKTNLKARKIIVELLYLSK